MYRYLSENLLSNLLDILLKWDGHIIYDFHLTSFAETPYCLSQRLYRFSCKPAAFEASRVQEGPQPCPKSTASDCWGPSPRPLSSPGQVTPPLCFSFLICETGIVIHLPQRFAVGFTSALLFTSPAPTCGERPRENDYFSWGAEAQPSPWLVGRNHGALRAATATFLAL